MSFRSKGRSPRRPFHPKRFDPGQPIWRPSLAPIAGVMLCAAILLTLLHPRPIHAVYIDVISLDQHLARNENVAIDVDEPVNGITIAADGSILWNCETVNEKQLTSLLQDSLTLPIEPITVFQPEPDAPYELAARVLGIIKMSGTIKVTFGGLEEHRQFGDGRSQFLAGTDTSLSLALSLISPAEDRFTGWPSSKELRGSLPPCRGSKADSSTR